MSLILEGILPAVLLRRIVGQLSDGSVPFADGRATAFGHARTVKHNEQATGPKAHALCGRIETALGDHAVFQAAAVPKQITGLLLSRCRTGMGYGTHIDQALMGGVRTDLSFTLFLSDPADYAGGALVIEGQGGEESYRLPAGSLVLYAASSLHRVEPVTSGERLVAAGWVRSFVRDEHRRAILFDLENTLVSLRSLAAPRPILDQLAKIKANLVRQWAED